MVNVLQQCFQLLKIEAVIEQRECQEERKKVDPKTKCGNRVRKEAERKGIRGKEIRKTAKNRELWKTKCK